MKERRNAHPSPTWPLLNATPGTSANGSLSRSTRLRRRRGTAPGITIREELGGRGTGGLPGAPASSPLSSPRRLGLLAGLCRRHVCPHPVPVPDVGILRAHRVTAAEGRAALTDAHARSGHQRCCSSPRPPPPAPRTREKSKQRRIGFCSIRGAGGGKSMFSKWEKRKSFRKDGLFPSREGFVNSTGHCGGSSAGRTLRARPAPRGAWAPWQPGRSSR